MVPFEFQEMIFSLLDVYLDKSPVQVAGDDWEAGECGNSYLIQMKEAPPCSHGNVAFGCFWLLNIGRDIENHHMTSIHPCNKNFADVQTLTLSQPHLVFQAAITESQDFGPCWASENKLWSRGWFQMFFMFTPKIGKILFFQMGWNHQPVIQSWSLSWSCYFQHEWMHVSISYERWKLSIFFHNNVVVSVFTLPKTS